MLGSIPGSRTGRRGVGDKGLNEESGMVTETSEEP